MSSEESSGEEPLDRRITQNLGYLLKHANMLYSDVATDAVAAFGIDPRELGVLRVIDLKKITSQQEIAGLLNIDRTSMVAVLDSLERKGIVSRIPQPNDRRKNVIELTAAGESIYRDASRAEKRAEQSFLARLATSDAERLRESLHRVVTERD